MWIRKDVKEKGKASMKNNYWKCVLAGLIIAVIGGGAAFGSGAGIGGPTSTVAFRGDDMFGIEDVADLEDSGVYIDEDNNTITVNGERITVDSEDGSFDMSDGTFHANGSDGSVSYENGVLTVTDEEGTHTIDASGITINNNSFGISTGAIIAVMTVIFIIAFIASLVILVISFTIRAFLICPIELGCKRFFRKNLDEPAKLSNIVFAFDNHYLNVVKTMFLRMLFTFLWSLLFFIPGIIKSYEYRLIPYILSENPDMDYKEAFKLSKDLMTGNKWNAFVYDLSFIGWSILSVLTCGILGIFFVNPYKGSADAALYEAIRYGSANDTKVTTA